MNTALWRWLVAAFLLRGTTKISKVCFKVHWSNCVFFSNDLRPRKVSPFDGNYAVLNKCHESADRDPWKRALSKPFLFETMMTLRKLVICSRCEVRSDICFRSIAGNLRQAPNSTDCEVIWAFRKLRQVRQCKIDQLQACFIANLQLNIQIIFSSVNQCFPILRCASS